MVYCKNEENKKMYSLYRAWLSLGPAALPSPLAPPLPATLPANPLDLVPQTHMNGSPDITLHVGPSMTHFSAHKTVLSAHSGFFKAALNNHPGSVPIAVPNVNVDEFSSLLTFMYTGYLDLNITNIYNILLATHILHMPRALEICRCFLMQSQPQETRSNIIKPIPSRKIMLPHQQIYAPIFSNLQKSEETPFKTVEKFDAIPSTSKISDHAVDLQQEFKKTETCEKKLDKSKQNKKRENSAEKVIIDIACCDGPVRFHRVVNKNYGHSDIENGPYEVTTTTQINRNDVLNKVMNENIRDKKMSDESHQAQSNNNPNELFTCLYCNHTFKSQYCYQKHARRHLNPVSLENKSLQKVETTVTKREVKLLDMNVQYYPCKTCGSKFPSYYFVHKHRKLCHPEEMADSNNKNNEMVVVQQSNNSNQSENSENSAVDVENDVNIELKHY